MSSVSNWPNSTGSNLVPRMRPFATSIFGEMSALALREGAINLGQGFPDTDGPSLVRDAALSAIRDGRGAQYPPLHGLLELRSAVAAHQLTWYGLDWNPHDEVVVTTGASEAIAASVLALVESGDEVIVLEPWFDLYDAVIALAGGTRVAVRPQPGGFRPSVDGLRNAVTPKTKLILLNSPHNPTGVVLTRSELAGIAAVAIDNDLTVLADEAYEHLCLDANEHVPIATIPGMAARTITVGSAGKSLSFTGWKVGWASGPAHLISAVRVVRQHLSFVSGGPFQWAVAAGLNELSDEYWKQLRADLSQRHTLLSTGLADLGLTVHPSQGTYFLMTDVASIGYPSAEIFCAELPAKAGVVAIPVAPFCEHSDVGQTWVRWAFCKSPGVLDEALRRLGDAYASQ